MKSDKATAAAEPVAAHSETGAAVQVGPSGVEDGCVSASDSVGRDCRTHAATDSAAAHVAVALRDAWSEGELAAALPQPGPASHKYSRGKLTLVAGSDLYPGAACLAARGAQRTGAGYTEVVTSEGARMFVLANAPSLVVRALDDWRSSALPALADCAPGARRALCIGPGFDPQDESCNALVVDVLEKAACPVLVDGGALAAIGTRKAVEAIAKRRARGLDTVITPHGGEAARLGRALAGQGLDLPGLATFSDDVPGAACALSRATGAIVVLKGPDTFVADGADVYPMYEGTAALAKAGTGDVLAGMISSLLAQGVPAVAASVVGATLHARAGNIAADAFTVLGVTPEDVIEAIPAAIRTLAG